MEEFPASKVQLQRLQPYLLGSFQSEVYPDITGQFGCGQRAKLCPSVGVGGGEARIIQMVHSSYSWTSNPLGHNKLSISQPHFPSKDIKFSKSPSQQKFRLYNRYFEEQIHWVPLTHHDIADSS